MVLVLKDLVFVNGLLLCTLSVLISADSIPKCTQKTCEDYRDDPGCPDVSNCTGILLPSPTKCNCCQYCLDYIGEGDECSPGVPGQASVQKICGPRLTCGENNVCVKMSSNCMNKRAEFEEKWKKGTLSGGEIEYNCADNGEYGNLQCIPGSICFCTSPAGDRIFGEMINMYSDMATRMDCACARDYWKAKGRIERVKPTHLSKTKAIFARCIPSGSYDILQCVQDRCACVDKKGVPQPSDAGKKVKYVFKAHIDNGQPWCFNLTHYHPGSFDTPCLKERGEILDMVGQLEENKDEDTDNSVQSIVLGQEYVMPSCDPDGSYSRVQETWESKYCVDPEGKLLMLFDDTGYTVPLDSTAANEMNCNCARTAFLLNQWNKKVAMEATKNNTGYSLPPLMVNIPKCCPNGNFESWQCANGVCYCVDKDGAQISPDLSRENVQDLPCYNNNNKCP